MEYLPSMEIIVKVVLMAIGASIGVAAGYAAMQILQNMEKMLKHFKTMSWSLQSAVEKLTYLEKRMENLTETGDEASRHLVAICVEYNEELAGGALRWALRRTLEEYALWRAARGYLKQAVGSLQWNLVVESAKRWILDEVLSSRNDAGHVESQNEADRLQTNLRLFEAHLQPWWKGNSVIGDPMEAFAILENLHFAQNGQVDSLEEAGLWSNGVSFRSRWLVEPRPAAEIRDNMERPHME